MTKIDGGAAFPRPYGNNGEPNHNYRFANDPQAGMSLRDWFAAQALSTLGRLSSSPSDIARNAYRIADAMLAARSAPTTN